MGLAFYKNRLPFLIVSFFIHSAIGYCRSKINLLCGIGVFILLCNGCGYFTAKRPPIDSGFPRFAPSFDAKELITTLENKNTALDAFKGVGSIILWQDGVVHTRARMAWIGAKPVRFQMVVLVSGYPMIKIAADGKWVYYRNALEKPDTYKKLPAKDPNLKWFMPVSMKSSELVALLSGRVPISHYHSAKWVWDGNERRYVLVLKKWWRNIEKIWLRNGTFQPEKIEVYNLTGTLIYGVHLGHMQKINGYDLPMTLTIYGEQGNGYDSIQLNIERCWTDVSVSPSLFVIPSPD